MGRGKKGQVMIQVGVCEKAARYKRVVVGHGTQEFVSRGARGIGVTGAVGSHRGYVDTSLSPRHPGCPTSTTARRGWHGGIVGLFVILIHKLVAPAQISTPLAAPFVG